MNIRLTLAILALTSTLSMAADWPQFRGPDAAGVSSETNLPTTWSKTTNVKWKAETPGRSVSSPVVFGNNVYLTSASGANGERLHVQCFAADTGKLLWHRQLTATGNTGCHPKSSMAAPTPCANADGVYCLFATADLACFDPDGNLKWYRSLTGDYPNISNQVGMASSPVLFKDTLIVPMDTVGDSFLAAIDTQYGKNVWKVGRAKEINWVTPTVRKVGDKAEIIFSAGKETVAYDPNDGKKVWSFAGAGASVPTALTAGDRVLLPVNGSFTCLKPKGTGMETEWQSQKLKTSYTTPLVYDGKIYALTSALTLVCADLKTGREVWTERIGKGNAAFWASPIAADGKIYTFDDEGVCTVLKAGDKTEVLAVNEMKEEILGTPAIANGALYIRTINGIYCIVAKN